MKVEVSHHVDASEPDAQGFHDYHYEYDVFVFTDAAVSYVARAYVDEPGQAHFLRREAGGRQHLLTAGDLQHPLFLAALAYLRAVGKNELSWLDPGRGEYTPVGSPPATSRGP